MRQITILRTPTCEWEFAVTLFYLQPEEGNRGQNLFAAAAHARSAERYTPKRVTDNDTRPDAEPE
jgi:hypothetical protein